MLLTNCSSLNKEKNVSVSNIFNRLESSLFKDIDEFRIAISDFKDYYGVLTSKIKVELYNENDNISESNINKIIEKMSSINVSNLDFESKDFIDNTLPFYLEYLSIQEFNANGIRYIIFNMYLLDYLEDRNIEKENTEMSINEFYLYAISGGMSYYNDVYPNIKLEVAQDIFNHFQGNKEVLVKIALDDNTNPDSYYTDNNGNKMYQQIERMDFIKSVVGGNLQPFINLVYSEKTGSAFWIDADGLPNYKETFRYDSILDSFLINVNYDASYDSERSITLYNYLKSNGAECVSSCTYEKKFKD